MIGPPNQGSRMALMLSRSYLFKWITGRAGLELGANWNDLEPNLATPAFEFGIIAGGQRNPKLFSNFFLPGQDDFTVSVDETKLAGATDFLIRPAAACHDDAPPGNAHSDLEFLGAWLFRIG